MSDAPAVLITGAAIRIGAVIAREFHARGFNVVVHYHSSAVAAEELVRELNAERKDSACCLQASLLDADAVARLTTESVNCFGRLDVLVNNASAYYPTPFGETTHAQWDETIDSNVRAAFFLSQALAAELKQHNGAIINIVDALVDKPFNKHAAYGIAKAGLKSMTKSLAKELAPEVRVNGVSPGAILWPPGTEDDNSEAATAYREAVLRQVPLGTLGTPEDIAKTACFLALDASYVTGAIIKVDGGRSLT